MEYLGLSGIGSFSQKNTEKYNKLLSILGSEGMLIQLERWMDENDLKSIIESIENNLDENDIIYY